MMIDEKTCPHAETRKFVRGENQGVRCNACIGWRERDDDAPGGFGPWRFDPLPPRAAPKKPTPAPVGLAEIEPLQIVLVGKGIRVTVAFPPSPKVADVEELLRLAQAVMPK